MAAALASQVGVWGALRRAIGERRISEPSALSLPETYSSIALKMDGWKMNILKLLGDLFPLLPWEMIQFDEHIFQMGGSTTNELLYDLYVSIKESWNMQMSSK